MIENVLFTQWIHYRNCMWLGMLWDRSNSTFIIRSILKKS